MSVLECGIESERRIRHRRTAHIVGAVAATAVGAVIASLATDTSSAWYQSLTLSPIQPPPWVFGAVWTVLYVLLAVSFARVASGRYAYRPAITGYIINLILNALWSPIFFKLHAPAWALVVMAALIVNLVVLMRNVLRVDRPAFYMLIPYLAWLSIAAVLNVSILVLN